MRLQGRITRWDDERGFGFVSWHGDGSAVFVCVTFGMNPASVNEILSVFWMTVVVNVLAFAYLAASGDAGSINQILREFWINAA